MKGFCWSHMIYQPSTQEVQEDASLTSDSL